MAQSTGASATDQAQQRAGQAAGQAKEKAQQATQQASQQARSTVSQQVDTRSTDAGEQVSSAADAIRQASQSLREKGTATPAANGLDTVAQRVDGIGSWLRDSDGDRILNDIEDFGRRNPLAVIASGVALGFAASRLLKASSERRYETGLSSSGPRYGSGGAQLPPAGGTTPGAGRVATPPTEGLTGNGVTGGTPATGTGYADRSSGQATPPSGGWMGEVGGEGEGNRPVR